MDGDGSPSFLIVGASFHGAIFEKADVGASFHGAILQTDNRAPRTGKT